MPCSICRFSGHNRSTCFWKNDRMFKNNAEFETYISGEDFYISSLKELIVCMYECDNIVNNIQDNLISKKHYIENYSIFNKKNFCVKKNEKKNDCKDCMCLICMDECTDLPNCYQCNTCNVIYHQNCIETWFKDNKKSCPACRADWGIKAKPPKYVLSQYHNLTFYYESKLNEFKILEHYTVDTLSRYYNISDKENLNQDILRYIPEYIRNNSIESRSNIDMTTRPIMSNGTIHLFNF